jgi:15-hydroxyprostaglandin dehydrogenase (NAD)
MSKVALVTGGSSGIGHALVEHLLSKGWNVVIADITPLSADSKAKFPAERTLFVKTDVSSFDEQAELFSKAFKWHQRLDFAALNAGIDDRDDIFSSIDTSKPPSKPDTSVIDIDLTAVYYGIKLFAHYASQNPIPGGKIVATASAAGLYPSPGIPMYAGAKFGVVGLVRSLALTAAAHNITINAICPALVVTNLEPTFPDRFPERLLTDMSVVIRAFDELMDENLGHTGQTVETCAEGLYYRRGIEPEAPSMKEIMRLPAMEEWQRSLIQRNIQRAARLEGKL